MSIVAPLSKGRSQTGFTLTSLLLILLILVILAAVLFPVFAQAREQARKTSCLSNMKQLGTAHVMYAQDYDEVYCPSTSMEGDGSVITWADNGVDSNSYRGFIYPYVKNASLFHCPSDPNNTKTSYGGNVLALADLTRPGVTTVTNAMINVPAEMIMLCEVGTEDDFTKTRPGAYIVPPPSFPLRDSSQARPAVRHTGSTNTCFTDGHVKARKLQDFYTNTQVGDQYFTIENTPGIKAKLE